MKIGKFIKKCRFKNSIYEYEIMDIVNNNQNVVVLDVRSVQEYAEGHLKGAVNIPVYDLEFRAERELIDKNSIIIAYCSAGIRSKKAVEILKKQGYRNLYNVEEGVRV